MVHAVSDTMDPWFGNRAFQGYQRGGKDFHRTSFLWHTTHAVQNNKLPLAAAAGALRFVSVLLLQRNVHLDIIAAHKMLGVIPTKM